ncbi:imm11 family protein [Ruegeria jejuensis]|uniref:imm11 family protein n=1 Tax=Ruegeria jejuensis TaxID=3233338 RepID=UPI00355BA99C
MPWILHESISDEEDVTWAFRDVKTGADRREPKIYMPTVQITPDQYPLDFQQTSPHTEFTDFMRGGGLGKILVSRAFRDLIEEMDPGHSHYYPVVLHCNDGRVLEDAYFLHKFADFIEDGIIVDESSVQPVMRRGKIGFYSSNAWPKLVWRSDKIKGRHVFADRYLGLRFCVSDAFLEAAEDRGFGGFSKIESFIRYLS